MLRAALLGVLGLVLFAARSAAADDAVVTPSSGGQPFIAARVLGGFVAYRPCTRAPCVPTSTDAAVALPVGTAPSSVVVESLTIGTGRYVLYAHAPAWSALIGAAPAASAPRVLWSGATGWVEGEDGERHGGRVEVTEPDGDGVVQVLVGEVQEDVSICGRPTILSPRLLDARDLTLKAVTVQRLRRDERDRAPKLEAIPSTAAASPVAAPRLLQGAAASSGAGSPAALTDGDLETTWSEKRGGDGRGEFVRMNAPEQAEITSISFVARPATRAIPKGAGPRKIWLATPDALFAVTFRADPWARAGAEFSVKLPAPIRTSCLAVVLDEAYSKSPGADVDVTLAEVTAHTEFDDNPDPAKLAGALAGGQARAKMAAALLARAGSAGHAAAASAYPTLDDAGRLLALEVIDGAPCSESAPIYLTAMQIGRPGEVHHATDRLMRCGREAAPALTAALANGTDKQKVEAAKLLSLVAPEAAVENIVKLLPTARPELRSELRAALARASQSPAGRKATASALSDATLPKVAAIDLLRAAAWQPVVMPEASARLGQLLDDGKADFRTRYLLLAPAASLAEGGDGRAEAFVLRALSADESEHVRARAAEVAGALSRAVEPLARVLGDADARVRAAAVSSIARLTDPGGKKVQAQAWPPDLFAAVAKLLASDPFTFVRANAAQALLGAPAGEASDEPLAQALSDESPAVRGRAVDVLGGRGAKSHARDVSARLDDEAEALDVRTRAARALGQMCDMTSLDHLTELALVAGDRTNPASRVLAASAAEALGRLAPPDLAKRLAPLTDAQAPRDAQEIGKTALGVTDRCPKSAQ